MSKTVEFGYDIGDDVTLLSISLCGKVVGLLANSQGCQYQVAWWSDGQRKCEWLFGFEIIARP